MELLWLDDFQLLAETGNFSRAAELRHVTQSAFSRRIKALEDWVGASLFLRTSRGCHLTEAGEFFRLKAPELARQFLTLREETCAVAQADALTLRFAATQTLSSTFFPEWILGLGEVTQMASLQLIAGTMAACEQQMYQGKAQFLLSHQHPALPPGLPADSFVSAIVGHDALIAVSAPDEHGNPRWRLTDGQSPSLPYLAYTRDSAVGRILEHCEPLLPIQFVRAPVMSCTLAAVLKSMIQNGKGMGWLPLSLVRSALESGELVRVFDPVNDIQLEVRLYRPDFPLSAAAERLWAAVQAGRPGV
ncbi:LysR family transcriptional regulator [Castellaniella sp. S9]|uniref:LysR family transcriptional regulator n=1 Tax=Castellaniella sp. S9 TaxID=2993652 RepID=UPI0022B3E008|nr:LysR family transcriptional regulator [Castellaniella sp. S9]